MRLCLVVALLLGAATPGSLRAEPGPVERAAEAFERGRLAYQKKDYATAGASFQEAYLLAPDAVTAFNEAEAWAKAKERAREATALSRALSGSGLPEASRRPAESRLRDLRAELGLLDLAGPGDATASVGHAERVALPARLFLEPGHYDLSWQRAGTTETKAIIIEQGGELSLSMPDAPKPPPDKPKWLPIVGFSGVGLGGLLLTAGIVSGGVGFATNEDLKTRQPGDPENQDLADKAVTLRTTANVLIVTGSVIAAGGAAALIVGWAMGDATVSARVSPTDVSFIARF